MFLICFVGAGADAFFEEVDAKGSKHEHALDACGRSVVVLWIKRVSDIRRLHDSGCNAVWLIDV